MPEFKLRYYCCLCGHQNELIIEAPIAPEMNRIETKCEKCANNTNMLLTCCPKCKESFRYFQSDLEFKDEINQLASTYVKLIAGIRDSLSSHLKEFNVPVPKRWSVNLTCECGHRYASEIALPTLDI